MTPQHRQQLEELAKWHEAHCYAYVTTSATRQLIKQELEAIDFHRNAAKLLREVVDEEAGPIKSVYWKTKDDAGTYRFLAPENISRSEAMKIAKRIYPTRSLRTVWME